ncbi:hypothetical protein A2Z33_04455 [Candidatus Gottesmanbacteria bacterium RBG_16_52_11]|uniref:Uncharacterized protein n=1 Tax=Candidatus Gottesmanbacteria bacterium RBG_16_52_11 TaxID=1798374 RepID=A0A1F5YWC9_9BACT|nr:MAG: hypothetical protein A2Z33_04455 [Candidatus Gottesmanbacteria bacterium RBG_16_52_11]
MAEIKAEILITIVVLIVGGISFVEAIRLKDVNLIIIPQFLNALVLIGPLGEILEYYKYFGVNQWVLVAFVYFGLFIIEVIIGVLYLATALALAHFFETRPGKRILDYIKALRDIFKGPDDDINM